MGTVIGYARVSTKDQNSESQEEALRRAGCAGIYRDIASGALSERSGLEQCLEDLMEGDTLIVWKLDRVGRSLPHLVQTVTLLKEKGVGFRSMTEGVVYTTNPAGEQLQSTFQISLAYSLIVLSLEKEPMAATFIMALRVQSSWLR